MTAAGLVRLYASGVPLVLKTRGSSCVSDEWGSDVLLEWNTREGLTALLHELAHIRHRHTCWLRQIGAATFPGECVMQEAHAWRLAERLAHRHGIPFDYAAAENAFATYGHAVRINWRFNSGSRHAGKPHPHQER